MRVPATAAFRHRAGVPALFIKRMVAAAASGATLRSLDDVAAARA